MVQIQSTVESKKMSKQLNQPKQERTQKRMEQVLKSTEELLLMVGLEKFSIPEVANVSGVPRASIYQFFPTKYDLLRHIALQHLNELMTQLKTVALQVIMSNPNESITTYGRLVIAAMIETTAKFYNQSEIASLLILSGPLTPQSYVEYQIELRKVSSGIRNALTAIQVDTYVPLNPDSLTILIEVVFTCMKHGFYTESYISKEICQEAYRIAMSYLTALKNDSFQLDINSKKCDLG